MGEEAGNTRESLAYKAKLAERTERYDEMTEFMRQLVEGLPGKGDAAHDTAAADHNPATCNICNDMQLTIEERNLLSVAFKNAVGSRRASWRIIANLQQKERAKLPDKIAQVVQEERENVEKELDKICDKILKLLDDILIPNTRPSDNESRVFYLKMKADYYRYICEYSSDEKRKKAEENARQAYETAKEISCTKLEATNPIRLGLVLNSSVFSYEILSNVRSAVKEAKEGFDCALCEFDQVSEETYKDSTLIMQLLRDNMTLWSSDIQECGNHDGGGEEEGGKEEGKNNNSNDNENKEKEEGGEKQKTGEGDSEKKEFVQQQ